MNMGESTDNPDRVLTCAHSAMRPEDISYPDREEPWTLRQAPRSKARGWARTWTNPAHSVGAWTVCSPDTRPWNGTPAPSRSASGRRRPGPRRQRRRSDAGLPWPRRSGRGSGSRERLTSGSAVSVLYPRGIRFNGQHRVASVDAGELFSGGKKSHSELQKLLLRSVGTQQADSMRWKLHNNMMEVLLLSHIVGYLRHSYASWITQQQTNTT